MKNEKYYQKWKFQNTTLYEKIPKLGSKTKINHPKKSLKIKFK